MHLSVLLSVYVVDKPVPVYLKKAVDLPFESFESVPVEERLKMGWVVKKSGFSFLNRLISTKLYS